ncbi:MAG: thioredoxin domain-containing protein [Candidatus Acidiferrales bacterium]
MRKFVRIVRQFWLVATALVLATAVPTLAQTSAQPAPQSSATASAPPASAAAAPSAEEAQLLKSAEAFVRKLFAWGADFQVKLGPLTQSPAADFYRVPILVTFSGQSDVGEVFISKDGKTMLRGEIFDTAVDPFAATRAKLRLEGDPSKGPADARVTVVEFSDYQCPHCRQLYGAMQTVEQKFPQIRVVYKDFPLAGIHPWAMTAAIGGRCAFAQSPQGFWLIHDLIFESQDVISSENVYQKMIDFAARAGLDKDAFKVCMASPEAKQAIEADVEEGKNLQINSTPTVFVNGRPVIGGDQATMEQYIQFELGPGEAKKSAAAVTPGTKPRK